MAKIPLKEAVRAHIQSQSLEDGQFQALEAMQQAQSHIQSTSKATQKPRAHYRHAFIWVACLCLIVISGLSLNKKHDQIDSIATEVSKNHLKLKPLEIESAQLADIRHFFAGLDFIPIESQRLIGGRHQLLGARHCSISGQEAAQLRVQSPGISEPSTLYMAHYVPEIHGREAGQYDAFAPLLRQNRGLQVEIWVEQDLLMVWITPPSPAQE